LSKTIILIAGPTASGKSKLAIQIAKKIKGEIINTDSMQVYKDFSILSSRPSKSDLKKIKHHLYGFISSRKHFSTGTWLSFAKQKIRLCLKKKKIPILVGGTGLYFEAITKGISKIPNIDFKKRNKVRNYQVKLGQKKFTKKSIFEWYKSTKSDFTEFEIFKIFLDTPREKILKNISIRTKKMIKNNCIDEVKNFLKLKIDPTLSANKIIGVKEIKEHLEKKADLNEVIELINIKTRQYAKRQVTWSRGHMHDWKREYSNSFSDLSKKILKLLS